MFLIFHFYGMTQTVVQMKSINGVYQIPCEVNGIPMNFIFDTGATEVLISITEAEFLVKQGLIYQNDIIESAEYKIADGGIIEGTRVNLRKIKIANIELDNVSATVIHNTKAPLLLGQSAISRLGKYSIDGTNLIIHNSTKPEGSEPDGIEILDQKYGYRDIKFDSKINEYDNLIEIDRNDNNLLFEYQSNQSDYTYLFNVSFDKLMLVFNTMNERLGGIVLYKQYNSSKVSLNFEEISTKCLDEYDLIITSFTEFLGKPEIISSDDELRVFWKSSKVILEVKNRTVGYEIQDNGIISAQFSNQVTFYRVSTGGNSSFKF